MNRTGVPLLAVLLVAAAAPAAAPAATRHWRVTATLTGRYANDVTATPGARCAAHYAERVDSLRVRLTSRSLAYDSVARAFTGPLRFRITAGRWTVAGSFVAQVAQPDGTLACAPGAMPLSCAARVVAEDGHTVSTQGAARLAVDDNTRGTIVSRITAPRLTEQYADAGAPPAGWSPACRLDAGDESVPVTPLFGLSSTTIADRALGERLRIPAAKLSGRRPFTVTPPPSRPSGCAADGFDPCTEQGGFTLRVTFTPARR